MGTWWDRNSVLIRRDTRVCPRLCADTEKRPCKHSELVTAYMPKEGWNLPCLALWSWTSLPSELWKINFCCLSHRSVAFYYDSLNRQIYHLMKVNERNEEKDIFKYANKIYLHYTYHDLFFVFLPLVHLLSRREGLGEQGRCLFPHRIHNCIDIHWTNEC